MAGADANRHHARRSRRRKPTEGVLAPALGGAVLTGTQAVQLTAGVALIGVGTGLGVANATNNCQKADGTLEKIGACAAIPAAALGGVGAGVSGPGECSRGCYAWSCCRRFGRHRRHRRLTQWWIEQSRLAQWRLGSWQGVKQSIRRALPYGVVTVLLGGIWMMVALLQARSGTGRKWGCGDVYSCPGFRIRRGWLRK